MLGSDESVEVVVERTMVRRTKWEMKLMLQILSLE